MSKFYEMVKQDTPRLVVILHPERGFQWGVVGKIPILPLVGRIVRVQITLADNRWIMGCPESALVIAWDADNKNFVEFVHPDIPADDLIGMLEIIKIKLLAISEMKSAEEQQKQVQLYQANGQPFRRIN